MRSVKTVFVVLLLLMFKLHGCDEPQPGERIWNIVAETQPLLLADQSKVCVLENLLSADFAGTFSMLNAAEAVAYVIESKLDRVESLAEKITSSSVEFIEFTSKLNVIENKLEEVLNVISIGLGVDTFPIRNSDVGTTGYTITVPGAYYLAEQINYAPAASGTSAIRVDVGNVSLNFLGRAITQTNLVANTTGVSVAPGVRNVLMTSGAVNNVTGRAIEVESGCSAINIVNITTKLSGDNGIAFDAGCSNITLDTVSTVSANSYGLFCDGCSQVTVRDSYFIANGNVVQGAGLRFEECNEIVVSDCNINDNTLNGLEFVSATVAQQAEFTGLSVLKNNGSGIALDKIQDVLVTNCFISGNGQNGILLNDSARIKVIDNVLDNNGHNNLALTNGTDNCYIFGNSFMLSVTSNLYEDAVSGPNSILGNYALATEFNADYQIEGATFINANNFDQSGAFPSPAPVAWMNMRVEV